MSISDIDYKILWGRAAGHCSNPVCRQDLTAVLEGDGSYHIGEMAHVIARSDSGPRASGAGGSDGYENLILLCPTCHRRIDKAPNQYPVALLHEWKNQHETLIRQQGKEIKFPSILELKKAISRVLSENRSIWSTLGPQSQAASDPGSNLHELWTLRKLNTIVPNNKRIVNMILSNLDLLNNDDYAAFLSFKAHASAFELHQYDRLDNYPTFPAAFKGRFTS